MTDHDHAPDDLDTFLEMLANLDLGQPVPAPSLKLQIDSIANDLTDQLMALELRRIDPNTPPLTDDERAQWADLYRAIRAAGDT